MPEPVPEEAPAAGPGDPGPRAQGAPLRVHIDTYGCTTNQGDSRTMAGLLTAAGHQVVDDPEAADVLVMNTCTVVDTTESRIAHRLGTWAAGGKPIVAAGCLAAANPDAVRRVAPDARLLDPRHLHDITALVNGGTPERRDRPKTRLPRTLGGTDAIVQLSEGCLFTCTYCSTKHARGDQTSPPLDELVADVRDAVNSGATLIQLTAQDTSGAGWDDGWTLPELVERITRIGGDFRVRIGMMHPRTADAHLPHLLDAMDHDKVYKFLHLPVQSGSERVLAAMRRGHTLAQFWRCVEAFRARFADGTVSTDLIVGFPGETAADHEATLVLVDRLRAEHVNVTRFSARPGTPAKGFAERVPTDVAKARSRALSARCLAVMHAENRTKVGRVMALHIVEPGKRPGSMLARGPGHEPVALPGDAASLPLGHLVQGRIVAAEPTYLVAEPLDAPRPMAKPVARGSLVLPVVP